MNEHIKIFGIAGSLRAGSFDRLALKAAAGLVSEGSAVEIVDLWDIPAVDWDEDRCVPEYVSGESAGGHHRARSREI